MHIGHVYLAVYHRRKVRIIGRRLANVIGMCTPEHRVAIKYQAEFLKGAGGPLELNAPELRPIAGRLYPRSSVEPVRKVLT